MIKSLNFGFILSVCIFLLSGCGQENKTIETSVETEQALIKRALEIHDRVLTVDTHADTPLRMIQPGFDMSERHDPNETGSKFDYPRMIEGGLDAVFFAAFVAKNLAIQMIDAVVESVEKNSNNVGLALDPDDAYELEKANKRAIYIGIENGYPIGGDLSNVEAFFNKGVRYITLVHSSNNDLADSATDQTGPEHQGLSKLGEEVVIEMNRLGIMVDVSHASDDVFYDAISISKAPIIASHSNARSVTDHNRNMTDEMLELIAKNNGVVQLTMLSSYLRDEPENLEREEALALLRSGMKPTNEMTPDERSEMRQAISDINEKFPTPLATTVDVVNHIDHIVKVAGIDHVGIGCDFDGGGGIKDVFDVSEVMNITIELVRRGYSETDIEKIWGKNLIRVFKDVQAVAESTQIKT